MDEKSLKVNDQTLDFVFIEGADCWQTKCIIDGHEIAIEIDKYFHNQNEIDWNHFERFFSFISEKGLLGLLIADSQDLVNELGKAFYRRSSDETKAWRMGFNNSIYYNGKTDGSFIRDGYSYSILFNFSARRGSEIYGDEYGLYLVDVENLIITGTRRHQC